MTMIMSERSASVPGSSRPPTSPSPAAARPEAGPIEDVDVRPYIRRDPWHRKLARRAITMPLLHVAVLVW